MFPAISLNPVFLFAMALLALLFIGSSIPEIVRGLAKEYYRYRKLIHDAKADIRNEIGSAHRQIEAERFGGSGDFKVAVQRNDGRNETRRLPSPVF